jgi:hypothetical protein
VGFNLRFNPLYTSLKGHIEAGAVGDVVCVRTVFTSSGRSLPEWKKSRSTGGGALLDLASHHVDLMRYILGNEVTQISARIRSHTTEDDIAILEYKTSDDIAVQSYFSISSADEDKIEDFGTGPLADRYNSLNVNYNPGVPKAGMLRISQHWSFFRPNIKDKLLPGQRTSFNCAPPLCFGRGGSNKGPDLLTGTSARGVEAAEESARTVIFLYEISKDRS